MPASKNSAGFPPLWWQPVRWATISTTHVYYRLAYRVRGWGPQPPRGAPTLVIANHQHEIESVVVVTALTFGAFAWRYPVFTVSSRRMWEPGFLAGRLPWLAFALKGRNFGGMFGAIGMQPIENELHSRPMASLAYTLRDRHGDLPLRDVFTERALTRFPLTFATLDDVLAPANAAAAMAPATLSEMHEPYRTEVLRATREQLEADIAHFERLQRGGATIFLAPEGFYTGDGRMQRLRGILPRLAPLARIWLAGISYDPFVGRRLSLQYRMMPARDGVPLDLQLKAARPVTVSALLGTWLSGGPATFSPSEAQAAVQRQLAALPETLFVAPELRRRPDAMTREALAGLQRLGTLRLEGGRYLVTARRAHPHFPRTTDMLAYQANFHGETLDGARALAAQP